MAIRSIRTIGDEVLKKECKAVTEVTDHTLELIEDMFDTMYSAGGVGLAAPQVGIRKQIVVIRYVEDGNRYVLDQSGHRGICPAARLVRKAA